MKFHKLISFLECNGYHFSVNEPGDVTVLNIHAWILAKQFLQEVDVEAIGEYVYPIDGNIYNSYNAVHFSNSKRLEVAFWNKVDASVTILNTPRRIKMLYVTRHPLSLDIPT